MLIFPAIDLKDGQVVRLKKAISPLCIRSPAIR